MGGGGGELHHLHLLFCKSVCNVCSLTWGMFNTVGDIFSTMEVLSTVGYHEYREDYLVYHGGHHDAGGGIMSTVEVFITVVDTKKSVCNVCSLTWGMFNTVGDIFSTMEVLSTVGYHEYREDYLVYHGGHHDAGGGIMSTVEVFITVVDTILSTVGDIMIHVEDIMSTLGALK